MARRRRRRRLTPSASSRPASKSKTASLEIFPPPSAQLISGKSWKVTKIGPFQHGRGRVGTGQWGQLIFARCSGWKSDTHLNSHFGCPSPVFSSDVPGRFLQAFPSSVFPGMYLSGDGEGRVAFIFTPARAAAKGSLESYPSRFAWSSIYCSHYRACVLV